MPVPDYDNLLVGQYIRAIENPDSIGFKNGLWFQSPRKVDDPNNRGFGVDIKHNDKASKLVAGRPGKYLTEQEERDLRNTHIRYSQGVLDKWTPKILEQIPSEVKQAMATGMIYRGDGVKKIIKSPYLRDAYYGGTDEDFQQAVEDYYKSKRLPERAKNHAQFMETHPTPSILQSDWSKSNPTFQPKFAEGGFIQPKDAWDKLSMAEKSEMMKVAVKNGITNLQEIRAKYNEFAEGGKKEEEDYYSQMEKVAEENYKDWGYDNPEEALVHALNDNTYNYKAFYREHPWSEANATTHWPDTYKTVYHPTFSNESTYSGQVSQYNPLGLPGGFWAGEYFVPMAWQLNEHEYKKGGRIYIKPSHRGRLTELKKRTGKTEAELYRTGSAATRKMITFARNARKWKHGEGGPLIENIFDGETEDSQQMQTGNGHAIYLNYPNVTGGTGGAVRIAGIDLGRAFSKVTGINELPVGHAGVIMVDDGGNSTYYDYGRFKKGTDKYGVSTFGAERPQGGNWRKKTLPKQKPGENDSVYVARIQGGLPDTQYGAYQALSFPNIDVKAAVESINKKANDPKRKRYGVGNTCADNASAAIVPFLQDPDLIEKRIGFSPEEYNTEGYSIPAQLWSLMPLTAGNTAGKMRKLADKTYIMNQKK